MSLGIRTNFEYHVPKNLDEALELLAEYGSEARPIAGGTDVIPKIKSGVMEFSHLVSLKELDELRSTYIGEDLPGREGDLAGPLGGHAQHG